MLRLAAIADDFTGATDLATALRERGLRVAVALGPTAVDRIHATGADKIDALIVALKTRTAPVDDAVHESLRAIRALRAFEPQQYAVKYCSTFDSTPCGNIGPVLDAVLDELSEKRTVIAPAFPDNRRTVYQGHLFVGADLLAESSMQYHPLTPMTDSRLSRILGHQTDRPIAEITARVVSQGPLALREALDTGDATYYVLDTATNADLETIHSAVRDWKVISGSAGIGYGMRGAHPPETQAFRAPSGRQLVVCGSASSQTRAQIAHARKSGAAMRQLDIDQLATDPRQVVAESIRWLAELNENDLPVIYTVGELSDIRPNQGKTPPAELVERVLAEIVVAATSSLGVSRVIVAGGETSGAVALALGGPSLLVGPQISPGVCWVLTRTPVEATIALALKSGNFGSDNMFTTAWETLDALAR